MKMVQMVITKRIWNRAGESEEKLNNVGEFGESS